MEEMYIFDNGRVRLYENYIDILHIDFYNGPIKSYEKCVQEHRMLRNQITDVYIRKATLFRKGYVQILSHTDSTVSKSRCIPHHNKNVLVIQSKAYNEEALKFRDALLGSIN